MTTKTETNDLKLLEDLERRFGEAMAQDIMAEIKKADSRDKSLTKDIPDYCGVKALSEGAELYRGEAQAALERLKAWKRKQAKDEQSEIVEWDGAFLRRQFERKYQFYLRFHKSYFNLYHHAMEYYRTIGLTNNPYKEVRTDIDKAEQRTINQAA